MKPDSEEQSTINELILDRLVDGDLDQLEYRKVLELAEKQPDEWRRMALAFLENQAIESELGSFLIQDELTDSDQNPENFESQKHILPGNKPATNISRRSSGNQSHRVWMNEGMLLPAIVGCLIVAFFVGWYIQQNQVAQSATQADVTDHSEKRSIDRETGAVDPKFIRLVGTGHSELVQTPVFNQQDFNPDDSAQFFRNLSPELNDLIFTNGLEADERIHVVPIRDKQGNQIILPIKEIVLGEEDWSDFQ